MADKSAKQAEDKADRNNRRTLTADCTDSIWIRANIKAWLGLEGWNSVSAFSVQSATQIDRINNSA
jgi:hypothetical protein